jgi:hypothetical protein
MIGAAAALAGVTRMTVSLVVISTHLPPSPTANTHVNSSVLVNGRSDICDDNRGLDSSIEMG